MPEDPLQSSSSGSESSQPDTGADEFEQALLELERNLQALRERYAQVQQDLQRQTELQQRLKQVQREGSGTALPQIQGELRQIKEQLKELEADLESRLLSDSDLMTLFWQGWRRGLMGEAFWQVVRIGGLGVVLGWILKSCAG
ncbi:MAG: hypothetical protein Fur006_28850 [Coleofasciculaceae cyanobacterium]